MDMSPDQDDYRLAMLLRLDPERLAALRRAISGIAKCPNCDEPNKADQKYCIKCGAALYPDLDDDERQERDSRKDGGAKHRWSRLV